jgi:hypothetical protein
MTPLSFFGSAHTEKKESGVHTAALQSGPATGPDYYLNAPTPCFRGKRWRSASQLVIGMDVVTHRPFATELKIGPLYVFHAIGGD